MGDDAATSPNSLIIDYQMGDKRYSCEIGEANAYDETRTCTGAAEPIAECDGNGEYIQINIVNADDVCISHIIVDGTEIDVTDQRIGDNLDTGPNADERIVFKRRYDVSNGIAKMFLPNGYKSSARVEP